MKFSKALPAQDETMHVDMNGEHIVFGRVGRFTYGEENIDLFWFDNASQFSIGRYCSIAGNVQVLLGGNHRQDWSTTFPFGYRFQKELGTSPVEGTFFSNGNVLIGNDVWIGQGVTIVSGVTVGDGAILATNAHVVNDVPAYAIAGGNPSRIIKMRFDDAIVDRLLRLRWWEFPVENMHLIAPEISKPPTIEHLDFLIAATASWPRS